MAYLAGCSWPQQFDHWKTASMALVTDMQDLFIYCESGGVGLPAQRELLSTPARTRTTLSQIPLFWGVVRGAPSPAQLRTDMRRLVEAAAFPPPSHVTLSGVLVVEVMLKKAVATCSGAEWDAKP